MKRVTFSNIGNLTSYTWKKSLVSSTEACLAYRQFNVLNKQTNALNYKVNRVPFYHCFRNISTSSSIPSSFTHALSNSLSKTVIKSKSLISRLQCTASITALVFVTYGVWKAIDEIAVNLLELKSDNGFDSLVLAAALTYSVYYIMKMRSTISPNIVHYNAIRKLEKHPGVKEVMGTSLVGLDSKICLITKGSYFLDPKMNPKWRYPRIQMMFPIQGPEREGIVSAEAKLVKGRYIWKLLSVDVRSGATSTLSSASSPSPNSPSVSSPSPAGSEILPEGQRIYVIGDREAYINGAVLAETRDPFLKALDRATAAGFENEDFIEAEVEELAAAAKQLEEDSKRRDEAASQEQAAAAVKKAAQEAAEEGETNKEGGGEEEGSKKEELKKEELKKEELKKEELKKEELKK